jgi:CHASE2 domain-containing sensor protein
MNLRLRELWQRWHWIAVHLVAFLVCLSAYTSNTFGLKTLTESVSSGTLNAILSSFYPAKRRDDIVVVLITDSDIDQFDDRFPVTYFLHQMALNTIADMKPKAVMVDFVFSREQVASDRSDANAFSDFLRDYPTPLFLASSTRTDIRPQGIHPKFEHGTLVTVPKFVNIAMQNAYCFYYASRASADGSTTSGCTNSAAPDARATAAYALYDFMCRRDQPDGRCPAEAVSKRESGNFFRMMWGSTPSQAFDFMPGKEPCKSASLYQMYVAADDVLTAADCPYHAQISLSDLLVAANDRALRQKLRDAFRDKIVIYGGLIGPNLDIIRPPTVRGIAGAHFHAMALDNLLAFGNSYKADTAIIGGGHITGARVNLAFFLFAYALTLWREYRVQSNGGRKVDDVEQKVLKWIALASYPFFCALSFFWLDLAPSNWIGAALTTVVLPNIIKARLDWAETKIKDIWKWWNERRATRNLASSPPAI